MVLGGFASVQHLEGLHSFLLLNGLFKGRIAHGVGCIGSDEWRHGSFGTKIEKAAEYRRSGVPLFIISEDVWAGSL